VEGVLWKGLPFTNDSGDLEGLKGFPSDDGFLLNPRLASDDTALQPRRGNISLYRGMGSFSSCWGNYPVKESWGVFYASPMGEAGLYLTVLMRYRVEKAEKVLLWDSLGS